MCPICKANCRCRKRGADGSCCSCHQHKARRSIFPGGAEAYVTAHKSAWDAYRENTDERRASV